MGESSVINKSPKDKIRDQVKARRKQMTIVDAVDTSKQIIERCIATIDWQQARRVHTYMPMPKWREVDTWPLILTIWENWPEILIAVPNTRNDRAIAIGPTTQWELGKYGIPEPRGGSALPLSTNFDVIVCPVLAFDKQGYRLGYGNGYYDKFLARHPHALTVGLSYEKDLVKDGIPHESHDVPMRCIVTEKKFYNFD
jgi:5-formyltetrahydrofolate cyclo-ligase